jgi:hypothetical protein
VFDTCIAKIEDSFYTINDYLDRENVCFMTTNFKEAVVVAFEMDTFNESKKQYAVLV